MNAVAPTSRAYTHDRCHQETTVGDAAFTNLASPLSDIQQTYCSGCKGMFNVSEFAWSDTSEKLEDYRTRYGSNAGPFARFLCSKSAVLAMLALAIFLGLLLAAVISPIQKGLLVFLFTALGLGVLLLMGLAALLISVITPMVHRRVCGESDPRKLC